MAKTYYKYAERDVNSQIDWSQVGKNLTDMLFDQAELRQNKRKELENASNDFGKVVSDMPTGISESWTNNTIDFANNVQEQRKLDDSLLAQGLMPLNMYLKKRELSKSSTEKFYGISKKMQAETAATVERIKSGTNMEREQRNLELIENLAVNGMPMLHDVTGELIVANMIDGPDGVKIIDPNKNNHMSVDQYDKLVTQKFDKYNFPDAAKAWVDVIGDNLFATVDEADRARGLSFIIEKSGAAFRDDINTYIDDFVNTIKANPLHVESVLTDTMGKYKTTYDTDQAASDPNYILLVPDKNTGVAKAEFTEAQEKDFEEFAERQLYARLDEKLKITSAGYKPSDPTDVEKLRMSQEQKDKDKQFALIHQTAGGDATAGQSLVSQQRAQGFGFDTEGDVNFINITDAKGNIVPVRVEGTQLDIGKGIASAFGLDPEEYLKWARDNNVAAGAVNYTTLQTKLSGIKGVSPTPAVVSFNTRDNINELNNAIVYILDDQGNQVRLTDLPTKVANFNQKLQAIAGPYNINTNVSNTGDVIVGDVTIENGIENPAKVLREIQKQYDNKPTLAEIIEQNPGISNAEAIRIFRQQQNN